MITFLRRRNAACVLALVLGAAIPAQRAATAGKLRILELKGSPFERGVTHGKALKTEIHRLVGLWKADLEKIYGVKAQAFIEKFLARTQFTEAIKRWTPTLLDEVSGIAKGAEIDFDTMLTYQLIDEVWALGNDIAKEKCTAIGVDRRGDQPTIVAQNLDIPAWYHGSPTVLHIRYPDSDLQTFVVTIPGVIGANGMSNQRLGVAVNTLLQLRPCRDGLPVAFVVRGLLEQKDHAAALAFVRRIRHASGQNYTVGGPDTAPAFECSTNKVARFAPFAGATHTYHTNHPLANDDWRPGYLRAVEKAGRTPWQGTRDCPRFDALQTRLARGKHVDLDLVKSTLRSHDQGRETISNHWTYACTIMVLGERPELHVTAGRPDENPFQVLRFARQDKPKFAGHPEQDALSYALTLDVEPATKHLEGSVRYRFRAIQPLDEILLDAVPGPDWTVSYRDLNGAAMQTERKGDLVHVKLGRTIEAGEEIEFHADLRGTPPGGFYFKDSRYGDALAFTDHYSIRARGWLPCADHPGDRAAFRLTLTYPAAMTALASGVAPKRDLLIPPAAKGRARIVRHTSSDIPPYMFAIAVGPYAEVNEQGDARLRPHLVYRQDVELAKKSLVHHAEWIGLMEKTIGPYAYGKYRVVQCPTRWGGFEAPGNVQLAERIFERDGGKGTLAHELAHMWFGDAVGYSEWREVWLSEGFASYFGPWLHAQTGGPSLTDSLVKMRARWLRSRDGRTKTVRWDGFRHPDVALNANTYPKGAWVLHMLRGEIGDEAFFAALSTYYRRFMGRSVVTSDFVTHVEESTGKDLKWFFAQWLDRKGCPELTVTTKNGMIVVEQTQPGAPYRFRLPVRWTDANGKSVKRVFQIEESRTELRAADSVKDFIVDPNVELLFR